MCLFPLEHELMVELFPIDLGGFSPARPSTWSGRISISSPGGSEDIGIQNLFFGIAIGIVPIDTYSLWVRIC